MSFAATNRSSSAHPEGGRRKISPLAVTIGVLVVIVGIVVLAASFWTEILWFTQLGYSEVIWTQWGLRAGLFVLGFAVMSVVVGLCLRIAYRSRPIYAPSTPEQATLDQYREAIEPLRRLVMIAVPAVLGFFAGAAASAQWENVLLWWHRVPFGTTDPEWGMDLSFFVFTLPVLRFVVSFLMAVIVIALIASLAMHYLYGGLRIGSGTSGDRTTRAARIQLSVLAAVLMVVVAANYWLDRYSILTSSNDRFEGASYADVHAVIPAKGILAGVALLVAVLFVVTAIKGNWRIPAIGAGLMIVSAIAIGGIYPAIVERFQVNPNAQQLEAEYIQRNIDATRMAFDIDDVDVSPYDAKTVAEPQALREDSETTASIRLLDP
ncbi:MAG: UPF0182 family protein, partial [Cellulomonadaceae bacterium]